MSSTTLTPGARFGPYEILSTLGAGGMGEVYRARDSKLNRDVAIKILLPSIANDPDRLARFSREAQVLASLNHPNIAHIYGLEDSASIRALIMELVEGQTLADRIALGAIRIADALPIARQIAEALEAAHDQGIVHRDLKPANIKLRADGAVKVLDFGLAKALDPTASSALDPAMSPTLSLHATQQGVILGTAAYMSPEQACGRIVDRRSDIWSFGALLFEMLTGRRAFDGDDVSSTMAFVITKEPDWTALQANTPAPIRKLLRRCLEKDPKRRLQSIGDARIEIDEAMAATADEPSRSTPASSPKTRGALPVLTAVIVTAIVAGPATWMLTRPAPGSPPPITRFAIVPPVDQPFSIQFGGTSDIAISPDGAAVVYRAAVGSGQSQLMIRWLNQLDAQALTNIGTGPAAVRDPFFSPDSRWVGYFDSGRLMKVATTGGSGTALCNTSLGPRGASWLDDDTIVFATDTTRGLMRVPAAGGDPKPLSNNASAWFPARLPGDAVLFTIGSSNASDAQVALLDLKTGQEKSLIRGGRDGRYAASGHIVYAAAGALRAVRFDPARREVIGDPIQIVDRVKQAVNFEASFDISRQGTLAYVPGGVDQVKPRQLVWVDRSGREEPVGTPPRLYMIPRISPDGTRLALQFEDEQNDIWTWDLARQTLTRVTFDPGLDVQPVWTADGKRIVFGSGRAGAFNLYAHAADGSGNDIRLTTSPNNQFPNSITPDGRQVIGYQVAGQTAGDVAQFAVETGTVTVLTTTPFHEFNVELSADGRYIAYQSNESGRDEIYVRPYPSVNDSRWQVSTAGGSRPAWARSGRELFYLDPAGTLMSVPLQTASGTFTAGRPARVFDARYSMPLPFRSYDVSPDGRRFLMIKDMKDDKAPGEHLTIVLNWIEELKTRLPATR